MRSTPKFAVGDKVAYSVQFIRSIGEGPTSPLAHARGVITEIKELGKGSGLMLASIDWDDKSMPERVNVFNLAKVGPNTKFCAC